MDKQYRRIVPLNSTKHKLTLKENYMASTVEEK